MLVAYMALAYVLRDGRGSRYTEAGHEFMLTQIFNGITFAGSVTILWGILDPEVMKIIGDTTMFLLIGGIAGTLFSLRQLTKRVSR